jgi:hypothetical protein
MHRRTLLAGASIALAGAAGCLSRADDPDSGDSGTDPSGDGGMDGSGDDGADSVPVLTGYAVADRAVTPDVERASDTDAWALLLASRDAAEAAFGAVEGDGADAVEEFVAGTAFDAGDRLLYVRAFGRQTCYDLGLEDEPAVAADGLPAVRVGVDRTAPEDQPCGDAITPVDLLLRLSFDPDAGSPDAVAVHVSGSVTGSEELLVEAEG